MFSVTVTVTVVLSKPDVGFTVIQSGMPVISHSILVLSTWNVEEAGNDKGKYTSFVESDKFWGLMVMTEF